MAVSWREIMTASNHHWLFSTFEGSITAAARESAKLHAGDGLHEAVALHRLVSIHRVQAGRVKAGQPNVAHDHDAEGGRLSS